MKSVDKILNKIGMDKVVHFFLSAWLTMVMNAIFENVLLAVFIVMGISIVKEVLDRNTSGFSLLDIYADMLGITISVIIIILT